MTASTLGSSPILGGLAAVLGVVFRFTRFGLAMRAAAAEPREQRRWSGIRVETMLTIGWGLAAVVGFWRPPWWPRISSSARP